MGTRPRSKGERRRDGERRRPVDLDTIGPQIVWVGPFAVPAPSAFPPLPVSCVTRCC